MPQAPRKTLEPPHSPCVPSQPRNKISDTTNPRSPLKPRGRRPETVRPPELWDRTRDTGHGTRDGTEHPAPGLARARLGSAGICPNGNQTTCTDPSELFSTLVGSRSGLTRFICFPGGYRVTGKPKTLAAPWVLWCPGYGSCSGAVWMNWGL